jgi:hypothetical protein
VKKNRICILFIFYFLASTFSGHAQHNDSLLVFNQVFNKSDSLKLHILRISKTDSLERELQQKGDSLHRPKNLITSRLDSARHLKKISRGNHKLDTLNPQDKIHKLNNSIDSLRFSLSNKVDSLGRQNLLDSSLNKAITNLKSQIDSLKNVGLLEDMNGAYQKVANVQSQLNEKVNGIETQINEKLDLFNENGAATGQLDLPGVNTPSLNLDNPLQDVNVTLPSSSLGNISPGLNPLEIGAPPGVPKTDIGIDKPKLPGKDIAGNLGKVGDLTKNINGYQEDLKSIKSGNLDQVKQLPDALESKLGGMSEVAGVKEQIEAVPDYKAMMEKWNADPEVAKEMALSKAKEVAVNHFAGHEEELKAAMEQLSKLKSKMPDPEGVVDLFAKRKNPMKGKPFIERIVPGLSLQFQKQGSFWLDVSPHITYKISGRFAAGMGWNERIAYDFEETQWDPKNHIYGLRAFVHFKLKENFWLKGEVENMNAPVRATPLANSDIVGRAWIVSYFGGIKKDFQLTKSFKANVQMLYNIYNPEKRSPYTNRFNVRMGFELPLKKKTKVSKSNLLE